MYIKPLSETKPVSGLPQVQVPTALLPQQFNNRRFGNAPPVLEDNTIKPKDIIARIWRGKWLFLTIVCICMLLAILLIKTVTPKYTSYALLMIGNNNNHPSLTFNTGIQAVQIDDTSLLNEMEVLRSYPMHEKVFDNLLLDKNPLFNPALQKSEPGIFTWLGQFLPEFLKNKESDQPLLSASQERARMVNDFAEGTSTIRLTESRVIELSYTTTDPELAATIANAYLDIYINQKIESKFDHTSKTNNWLDVRVKKLREKVKIAETEVEKYRQDKGLLQTSAGSSVYSQQLSELNTQLILAGTERSEREARLKQARGLTGSNFESASEIIGSELIRRLREQESSTDRKLAELSTSYGEKHPSVVSVKAEKEDIKNKIAIAARKIINGLENEASIARSRESALRSRLRTLENQLAGSNTQEIKLRALEREAEASRNLLNTFLARFNETNSQKDIDIQQPDAKVVSYGTPSISPSFPRKGPILALTLFGSIILGLMAIFLKEAFDKGFRSGVQIEEHTGLPSLGMVPVISKLHAHFVKPESYVLKYPSSEFSEAIRAIYTNMLFTKHDERAPKIVQFTSAYPGEGKSTIARCLAVLKRQSGVKTVIIDANLRSPTLHKNFDTHNQPGLAEYLSGMSAVHEIIAKDKKSGTYLIPAGLTKRSPTDLLPSRRLDDLFNDLSEDFDLIIVDSPPVLTVPDARILASRVDMSVVVIKWADTPEEIVEYALKQLSESGAPRMSTVLSMVDSRKHAQYNYADSGLYARSLK